MTRVWASWLIQTDMIMRDPDATAVGAITRSADCDGAESVLFPKQRAAPVSCQLCNRFKIRRIPGQRVNSTAVQPPVIWLTPAERSTVAYAVLPTT